MAALLCRLYIDGLINKSPLSLNARAFFKYKSPAKCALIFDKQSVNHPCSFKARPFRLPSLEALAGLCVWCAGEGGAAWGTKIDLGNCYWSVHLPPAMGVAVRVAVSPATYALVLVPSDWHQPPGLVHQLIGALLSELPDTQVIIVTGCNLFSGTGPLAVHLGRA